MKDFNQKISFIFNHIANKDINQLTKLFIISRNPTKEEIRSRKVTIKKWLEGTSQNANKFPENYSNYNIAQIKFKNGQAVFDLNAFFTWDYNTFEKHFNNYENELKILNKQELYREYKYIYFYSTKYKDIYHLEIEYLDTNNIKISTNEYPSLLEYIGNIERHTGSDIIYLIASNDEEKIFFVFSELDFKTTNYYVYGIGIDKDFNFKTPKASFILWAKKLLDDEGKKQFKYKINATNTIIANNKYNTSTFTHNISNHLYNLYEESEKERNKSLFENFFREEFSFFYTEIFLGFKREDKFYINSLARNIHLLLKFLIQNKDKVHLKIFYTIEDIEKSMFSSNDERNLQLYNNFIKLSEDNILSFEFIISLRKNIKISRNFQNQIKKLEEAKINVYFYEYDKLKKYSTILVIDNYLIGISCETNYIAHYLIKKKATLEQLHKDYNFYKENAVSFENFIEKLCLIKGEWFLYGYGSQNTLKKATLRFYGFDIDITMDKKTYKGDVKNIYKRILISSELFFIDFDSTNTSRIKIVSMMTTEKNSLGSHTILFAILSKIALDTVDIENLLSIIVDKNEKRSSFEKGTLKTSHNINQYLSDLLNKYHRIE